MHQNRIYAAVLLALFAATSTGCGIGKASVTESAVAADSAPLPVLVTRPETADIFAIYETTETIASDAEAAILARVEGQVTEILVEEGDTVSKGQILARLDGKRLRFEMQKAKADLEKTTREYDRSISLHERGLVSAASYDDLQYDLQAMRANFDIKTLNYNYTAIRSTISGIISSRDIKVGTNVNVGQLAFVVTDTSRLVAYLNIPQTELSKFSSGHAVAVKVDSMPDAEFNATIARISPAIDPRTGTFRATAYLNNHDGGLAPGMFGRFTIAYEKHVNALVIPVAAAVQEDNEIIVFVVQDGAAVRREIQVGIRSNGVLEVLSGLDSDDVIITTGQSGLRDGSSVLASTGVNANVSG